VLTYSLFLNFTVLFDTSLGGFTFADQFLQFATRLPNRNLYGIGENEQPSFRHSFEKYPNWPLWGRDEPPNVRPCNSQEEYTASTVQYICIIINALLQYDANLYGVQPYYTVLEDDGNAHSVAIVNSNAQGWWRMLY
jgi:maltase-glucoamylase